MFLSFCYLYKFPMFFFFFFFCSKSCFQTSRPKLCNIIFLFLHKIRSVGPVDQQIYLILRDLNQYAVGCVRGNNFYRFFSLETVGWESL